MKRLAKIVSRPLKSAMRRGAGRLPLAVADRLEQVAFHSRWGKVELSAAIEVDAKYVDRSRVWESAANQIGITPEAEVRYFEFGVWEGESITWWSKQNTNPDSRFHGFDTFTGLPEDWKHGGYEQGTWDTGGSTPDVGDSRVSFHAGLFSDTLPGLLDDLVGAADVWHIVHFDADLFTSTVTAMANIFTHELRHRKMLWIFDEFIHEEAQAFQVFERSFDFDATPLVVTPSRDRVAFLIEL